MQALTVIQILRATEVCKEYGIGKTLLYAKGDPKSPYHDPAFPAPVSLGGRSVGWYRHELEAWAISRPRVTPEIRKTKAAHAVAGRRAKRMESARA
ncbi:helix-turn-helix transcriptional regulator [Methylomagnum sp.]